MNTNKITCSGKPAKNGKNGWNFVLQSKKLEAIGSFASALAHDFNNILAHIRSSAQFLMTAHDKASEEYRTLKEVEDQVVRGSELTKQILLFTRASTGRAGYINVNSYIKSITKLLNRIMPKNIRITTDLNAPDVNIRMKPCEFEQILMNLAINARDAMPGGGAIKIAVSIVVRDKTTPPNVPALKPGKYIRIGVTDTGSGIPKKMISKIFDLFYTSKSKNGGTGLGLSIVYAIVRRRHGYIQVASTPTVGTTMTLYFPCRVARPTRNKDAEKNINKDFLIGNETILIIDDEELLAKSTARFLERYGYRTLTANDGQTGLDLFNQHEKQINLVLLDMELPKIDGPDCLKKILAVNPAAKVILLTAHFIKPGEWDPIAAGAKAFVQKPFDSNELLRKIRSILN